MRQLILAFIVIAAPALALGAEGHVELQSAPLNLKDPLVLERGAKYFVNYCLSCHSASYMRYNRMAADLGLSDAQVQDNLMFVAEKVGETMKVAMRPTDAERWFGVAPPDLSVIARSRGPDWLYTYLLSFYLDEERPFGVNNLVFKDTAMPHVLAELQGLKKAVYETKTDAEGTPHEVVESLELVQPGQLSGDEYKLAVADLVSFLAYVGEPAKVERQRLGVWVLLYLLVFLGIAYALKKEYWKDVH